MLTSYKRQKGKMVFLSVVIPSHTHPLCNDKTPVGKSFVNSNVTGKYSVLRRSWSRYRITLIIRIILDMYQKCASLTSVSEICISLYVKYYHDLVIFFGSSIVNRVFNFFYNLSNSLSVWYSDILPGNISLLSRRNTLATHVLEWYLDVFFPMRRSESSSLPLFLV